MQQAPRYSAREALASALKAYQAAVELRGQREVQATAARDAAVHRARQHQTRAQQLAQTGLTTGREQARRLLSEVERLSKQADQELTDLGVTAPSVLPGTTAPYPTGPSAMRELQDEYATVAATATDMRRAGQELKRVRQLLLVRIRRALRLPP